MGGQLREGRGQMGRTGSMVRQPSEKVIGRIKCNNGSPVLCVGNPREGWAYIHKLRQYTSHHWVGNLGRVAFIHAFIHLIYSIFE